MALFRYIYDLSYEPTDKDSEWQFLAKVYIAADKYQVEGLATNVTRRMRLTLPRDGQLGSLEEDFLVAMKIVFDNTTSRDDIGRAATVDLCVRCISGLKETEEFEMLLSECDGLGAAIIAHENLSLMLEGTWMCGYSYNEHRGAAPLCASFGDEFTASYIRRHRDESDWECIACFHMGRPVCTEHQDTLEGLPCRWVREE